MKWKTSIFAVKENDVDQVIQLILRQLRIARGEITSEWEGDLKDRILVAHDLTPADTVQFKKLEMSGFVTNLGSPISHVAILARSLRIPAVVGLHGSIRHIEHGAMIAVDSRTGTVVIDPDEEVLEQLKERRLQDEIRQQQLSELLHLDSRTEDGHEVTLLANVEVPSDIDSAATSGADGVGLYRTEYLFMNRTQSPSEKEQFEAYSNVVKALGKVTIRTLDLGADKQVDGGRKQGKVAINPALGVRAVRFCLRSPGIFRTQLRAIFRASVFGSVQCLIPMLSNLEELNQVMVIIDDVKSDLDQENVDYDASVPIGGMIEVPAAAILADQFAERLGFLSIGTNDLIQYTLAIDRVDDEVNYLYDPLHLSILRLVKYTIEAGAATGTPVTMCGEMAGDGIYTRLLLGLGLRNFSMDPAAIPEVKHIIRNTRVDRLKEQVEGILRSPESAQRVNLLSSLNTDQDIASYLTHGS